MPSTQPRGRKRELRGDVRQRDLVSAFVALLNEGVRYEDVSVESIAKRAGITRAGFYYFFESREDLVKAVLTDYVATRSDAIVRLVTGGDGHSPRREIEFAMRELVDMRRADQYVLRALVEASASNRFIWATYRDAFDSFVPALTRRIVDIRAAQGRPISEHDAANLAQALIWTIERNFYRVSVDHATDSDWSEVAHALTEIWCASVTGCIDFRHV